MRSESNSQCLSLGYFGLTSRLLQLSKEHPGAHDCNSTQVTYWIASCIHNSCLSLIIVRLLKDIQNEEVLRNFIIADNSHQEVPVKESRNNKCKSLVTKIVHSLGSAEENRAIQSSNSCML